MSARNTEPDIDLRSIDEKTWDDMTVEEQLYVEKVAEKGADRGSLVTLWYVFLWAVVAKLVGKKVANGILGTMYAVSIVFAGLYVLKLKGVID